MRLLPTLPPRSPKHTEERLKLLATCFQTLALTLVAAGILAPVFNHALVVPTRSRIVDAVIAAICELVALTLLRYIPVPPAP